MDQAAGHHRVATVEGATHTVEFPAVVHIVVTGLLTSACTCISDGIS